MRKHSNIKRNKNYRNGDYPKPISSKRDNGSGLFHTKRDRYIVTGAITFSAAFCIAYIASAEFMGIGNSDASTNVSAAISSGSYFINVTSLGEVNIAVDAIEGGGIGTGNDIVTVNTNTKGYRLYLSTNNSNANGNRMYLNGDSSSTYYLNPTSGNTSGSGSSSNGLDINSWGFSINNGSTYSPVPLKGNETKIADTWNTLTPGTDTTRTHTITYGVKADMAVPAGNYRNTVNYSVVAEANSVSGIASVSPTSIGRIRSNDSSTTTITVTVPLFTNMEYGDWTVKVGANNCTNVSATKVDEKLNITCKIKKNLALGTYAVTASSSKYGDYVGSIEYTGKTIFDVTEMQQMSTLTCENTTTPDYTAPSFDTNGTHHGDSSFVPQTILKDTRDNKKYVIQKMADGKCWMVQNLALGPGTYSKDSTGLPYGMNEFTLVEGTDFTNANVVKTGSHINGDVTSAGNEYSAASASAGTYNISNNYAKGGICPKFWHLPGGGWQSPDELWRAYHSDYNAFSAHWHPTFINGKTDADWLANEEPYSGKVAALGMDLSNVYAGVPVSATSAYFVRCVQTDY